MPGSLRLSVIVPTLDEAGVVAGVLADLQALRSQGHQLILVDGGSEDGTCAIAAPLVDRLLTAAPGRARQMNSGAAAADGDVLWFVHADSRLPRDAAQAIGAAVARGAGWGRFDVRLSGRQPMLRLVEGLMNLRSRLTGIATGDQGLFVTRTLFEAVCGFRDIPLMEDIDLSRRLKRRQRPACLRRLLVASSRRWEEQGIVRTVLLMWGLRLAWFCGVPARRLAALYD
jgi:rSAM/selenodomain-associated transferase 2